MQTFRDLDFGDGTYTFALKLPQIVAIEAKCGPIGEVYARLLRGLYIGPDGQVAVHTEAGYKHADLVEIIRQGLIGGEGGTVDGQSVKVGTRDANTLVDAYVIAQPLVFSWKLAAAILGSLIEGYEPVDEAQKKSSKTAQRRASRGSSTGGKSSQTAQ